MNSQMTLPLLAALVAGVVHAAAEPWTSAQFRAAPGRVVCTNGSAVAGWSASLGRGALIPVHALGSGWSLPRLEGDGITFASATPLAFSPDRTGTVARAFLVVTAREPAPWSTLLDAPTGVRLKPTFDPDGPFSFAPSNCLGAVSVSVDGTPDLATISTNARHLVEVAFETPPSLSDVYLGGSPATLNWGRSWAGTVHEAVFFAPGFSEENTALVRAYLSLRWRLGLEAETFPDIALRLRSLGIDSGALYSSILLLR